MTIRSPKYNSQGYTLIELIVTLILAGIIVGFAAPSLLSLNKPLRDASLQFKSQLSLIRSKAISSNAAYRIRPKFPKASDYKGQTFQQTPHRFIVEYAANCQVDTYGSGVPAGWMGASQLDLDLPEAIGIATTPAPVIATPTFASGSQSFTLADKSGTTAATPIDTHLNWSICFDNRGIASQSVEFTLKDFQANNRATSALIKVNIIGQVDITTRGKDGIEVPRIGADSIPGSGNPAF